MSNLYSYCVGARRMRKFIPHGQHVAIPRRVYQLIVIMEDKENLPQSAEPEAKRAKLSLSLPKDRFSFSVDDRDMEEAMKKYSVKTAPSMDLTAPSSSPINVPARIVYNTGRR